MRWKERPFLITRSRDIGKTCCSHNKTCFAHISGSSNSKWMFSPANWSYSSGASHGHFQLFYFGNLRDVIFWQPLLGHPDGQFSITGNQIFTKFGILLYLDTPTTPWGHPCPNADIGLMLPSHVSHSQKFMIQFGAVGNKSNQVVSHGKTSLSESRVNSWTALFGPIGDVVWGAACALLCIGHGCALLQWLRCRRV